jgi:Na+-transporting methylmalonyl-CoA/oxaloacetate decarboxylase gamma subunit
MSTMSSALIITVIGMGLVFIAILALWGLMELMVRVTARYAAADNAGEEENEEGEEEAEPAAEALIIEIVDNRIDLKRKAAAAAVVLALAQAAQQPAYTQMASYTSGSAWQAVSRGGQLNQRATLYNRKSRGN